MFMGKRESRVINLEVWKFCDYKGIAAECAQVYKMFIKELLVTFYKA